MANYFLLFITTHTPGLRLLHSSQSDAILASVRKMFKSYPFMYDTDAVEVSSVFKTLC